MLTGCGPQDFKLDASDKDKIIHVVKGAYYGQPNMKRATFHNDPRQCIWYASTNSSQNGFTAPIGIVDSSVNGIMDYHANCFDGQLRGNIIGSKYGDGLVRIVLTPRGTEVVKDSKYGIPLVGDKGFYLTLAPDGTIIESRYSMNQVYYSKPIEEPTTTLKVLSVFPYRGRSSGGNVLSIYGVNFLASAIVTVGGTKCTNQVLVSSKQIDCTLPGGSPGSVDVIVTQGIEKSKFAEAYRYITGLPE